MDKIEKAELVNVEEKDGKITLTFLANERVYDINWNKKAYDSALNDYVESEIKEQQVENWSQEYFGVPTKDLPTVLGATLPIYSYDTYASLWESQVKFTKEDKGKKENTVIDDIQITEDAILIFYTFEGQKHRSRMGFSTKVGNNFYLNPIQQRKQFKNFEQKFGVPVEDKDTLVGKKIQVTVKQAFSHYYGDVTYIDD